MVFEVSLKELIQRYGKCIGIKELSIYYDNTTDGNICEGLLNNSSLRQLMKFTKKNNVVIKISDDLLSVMYTANKMVKDRINCNSRYRNRFYVLKHYVMRDLYEADLIDEIIDNGDYLLFKINDYEFHQPKTFYKSDNIETTKTEKYECPSVNNITFNYEVYKLAVMTMAFFISLYCFNKDILKKKIMKVGDIDKCKKELIDILHQFNEGNLRFFKRVWANNNMDISIEDAVNNLDIEKLPIVYFQAKNTVKRIC